MRWSPCALAALVLVISCRSHPVSRCRRICARETECAERLKVERDRSECIETCTSIDRDPALQTWVDKHARCVDEAVSCEAVLRCD